MNNNDTYFDSFRVAHIPKEIKIFIDKSIVVPNVFKIQAYDSIMCGYFCIGFIHFMLADKTLTVFISLFAPNNFNPIQNGVGGKKTPLPVFSCNFCKRWN